MAIVHKGASPLQDKKKEAMNSMAAAMIIGGVLCIGFLMAGTPDAAIIVFVAFFFMTNLIYHGAAPTLHGSWGEEKALSELQEKLSDDYHIFVDVRVHEKMESDLVITGPNGVFIVEIKNYKGKIEGRADDREWTLHKTGRRGGQYTKTLANPLRQLRRNLYVLSQYLKIQKTPAWLEGRVYFVHKNEWVGGCIPDRCVANLDVLAHSIRVHIPRRYPTAAQLEGINASLEKCIAKAPAMTKEDFEAKAAAFSH